MRYLISACSGLGDTILKIPLLRALSDGNPEAIVDVVAFPDRGIDELLAGSPWVANVLHLDSSASLREKMEFFWSLRSAKYEAIFLSYEAAHPWLIWGSYLAGVRTRVVHRGRTIKSLKNQLRYWLTPFLPGTASAPLISGRHKIDLNFDLLETYFPCKSARNYTTPLPVSLPSHAVLERFGLTDKGYVVLQPGAAKGAATPKTWAPQNFCTLIRGLKQCWPELEIVTVGDRGDAEASAPLQKELPNLINTAGSTSLGELAGLLTHSAAVVCHDSGVMHLANALEAHVIALYGPTDDTCTQPLGTKSRCLFSNNECRRLMYNWQMTEQEISAKFPPYHCLSAIAVQDVFDALRPILESALSDRCQRRLPVNAV